MARDKWQQCSVCRGSGLDCNENTCAGCGGTLIEKSEEGSYMLSEEELVMPEELRKWCNDTEE